MDLERGKSIFISPVAFYKDVIGVIDKKREADFFYLDFRKAFDSVSHKILMDKC